MYAEEAASVSVGMDAAATTCTGCRGGCGANATGGGGRATRAARGAGLGRGAARDVTRGGLDGTTRGVLRGLHKSEGSVSFVITSFRGNSGTGSVLTRDSGRCAIVFSGRRVRGVTSSPGCCTRGVRDVRKILHVASRVGTRFNFRETFNGAGSGTSTSAGVAGFNVSFGDSKAAAFFTRLRGSSTDRGRCLRGLRRGGTTRGGRTGGGRRSGRARMEGAAIRTGSGRRLLSGVGGVS